jgi:hypothetical protein
MNSIDEAIKQCNDRIDYLNKTRQYFLRVKNEKCFEREKNKRQALIDFKNEVLIPLKTKEDEQ